VLRRKSVRFEKRYRRKEGLFHVIRLAALNADAPEPDLGDERNSSIWALSSVAQYVPPKKLD
jgi:hypothetical protein